MHHVTFTCSSIMVLCFFVFGRKSSRPKVGLPPVLDFPGYPRFVPCCPAFQMSRILRWSQNDDNNNNNNNNTINSTHRPSINLVVLGVELVKACSFISSKTLQYNHADTIVGRSVQLLLQNYKNVPGSAAYK